MSELARFPCRCLCEAQFRKPRSAHLDDESICPILITGVDMKNLFQQKIRRSVQVGSALETIQLCQAQSDVDEAARVAIVEAIRAGQDAMIDLLSPLLTVSWKQEPLTTAAKVGAAELVKKLIPHCDADDDAALCLAARNGHLECVKVLLGTCSPFQRDSQALYEAALHGHADVVFQLILFSDPKARDSRALFAACRAGHLEVVKHLLPFSSKIQCAQRGFEAAAEHNHEAVIKFLIGAGLPDPEDTYSLGLNIAAARGHVSLVRTLLWAIVRTGFAPRDFGQEALFVAAKNGHAEVVKSVMEFAHKTAYPEAALYAALLGAHDPVADLLVRRVNLDHVRELISDEDVEVRLDRSIARAGAAAQNKELRSDAKTRERECEAAAGSPSKKSHPARRL